MANKKRNGTFPSSNFRFKCTVPLFGCKYSELSNLKLQNTVAFIHYDDIYYRMYPVSIDMGVALQREVKILRDAKQGAYGTTSQTSSIKSSKAGNTLPKTIPDALSLLRHFRGE